MPRSGCEGKPSEAVRLRGNSSAENIANGRDGRPSVSKLLVKRPILARLRSVFLRFSQGGGRAWRRQARWRSITISACGCGLQPTQFQRDTVFLNSATAL